MVLTVAEYLLKVNYTPPGSALTMNSCTGAAPRTCWQSGKLFELNYGLPIGTHYPGIEEVTSALISATGLSVFEAGLVVAGVAHLLFILFLYLAFCVAIRSHRIAGIAVLIYFSAPALTSFNSMFVYETLALAFFGMCIVAGLRSAIEKSPSDRRRWFIVAVLCIFATIITHHVTSYMLTAFLVLVAIASRLTGSRNTAAQVWHPRGHLRARGRPAGSPSSRRHHLLLQPHGGGHGPTALRTSPRRVLGRAVHLVVALQQHRPGALGLLAITVLIAVGCWQAWKRHRRHPWIIGMMIGCTLGWILSLGIRLGTPDGQELAGRAATFIYIPVSVIAALALTRLVNSGPMRRLGAAVTAVVVAAVVALLIDGLANGWPPFWERLPGPHQVASFEALGRPPGDRHRQLEPGRSSARATGSPPTTGIYPVLIGYGDQNPLQVTTFLYSTPTWTPAVARRRPG